MPEWTARLRAPAVRAGGPWAVLPLVALSSRADPADIARGGIPASQT